MPGQPKGRRRESQELDSAGSNPAPGIAQVSGLEQLITDKAQNKTQNLKIVVKSYQHPGKEKPDLPLQLSGQSVGLRSRASGVRISLGALTLHGGYYERMGNNGLTMAYPKKRRGRRKKGSKKRKNARKNRKKGKKK